MIRKEEETNTSEYAVDFSIVREGTLHLENLTFLYGFYGFS